MARLLPQNSIVGDYRLIDFLSAGGMGEVYRAVHATTGRVAAVKVLANSGSDEGLTKRFINEARIQASLSHPYIVEFYQFLEVNGHPCIVMEYVDGQTLTDLIKQSKGLRLTDALYIFKAVVEAIGYIHSHNIIHRDIKSSNVKIGSTGRVKVLDFGIAKGSFTPGLTVTGAIVGTLLYISPEQLKGMAADARSDIWALGVLLYEMVTGIVPFNADTFGDLYEKINAVSYKPPLTINQYLPREIETIISRCLKKNPADRYQTTQELLRDIDHLIAKVCPPAPQTVVAKKEENAATSLNKLWFILPVVVFTLLIFLIGGIWLVSHILHTEPQRVEQERVEESTATNLVDTKNSSLSHTSLKAIIIDVFEGNAEIHRDGQYLGTTPFELKAPVGEKISVTLKRPGYIDKPVEFNVSDNKRQYTFAMEAEQ
jgi:eukaryotic-like serine/threonine-protein kinase